MPKAHCNQMVANMIHIYIEMYHIQPRKFLLKIHIFDKFLKINLILYEFDRDTETLVHLLKGSLGTGILVIYHRCHTQNERIFMYFHFKFVKAMPKAFHQSGWLSGLVNTILIGILCTYGLHILVRQFISLFIFPHN